MFLGPEGKENAHLPNTPGTFQSNVGFDLTKVVANFVFELVLFGWLDSKPQLISWRFCTFEFHWTDSENWYDE